MRNKTSSLSDARKKRSSHREIIQCEVIHRTWLDVKCTEGGRTVVTTRVHLMGLKDQDKLIPDEYCGSAVYF